MAVTPPQLQSTLWICTHLRFLPKSATFLECLVFHPQQNHQHCSCKDKPLQREQRNLDCSLTIQFGEIILDATHENIKPEKIIAACIWSHSSHMHYTLQICIKKVEKLAIINKQYYTISSFKCTHLGTCPEKGQMCIHTFYEGQKQYIKQRV